VVGGPARCCGREGEEVRFAYDSPLEGSGFEPSVPLAGPTSDSQSVPIETPPREEDQ